MWLTVHKLINGELVETGILPIGHLTRDQLEAKLKAESAFQDFPLDDDEEV
jgi:hypothetical protein